MQKKSPTPTLVLEPAVETLFAMSKGSFWPQDILTDPALLLQTKLRQTLHAKLSELFSRIKDPATELIAAIEAGVVEADAVAEVYDLLAEFLDADWHHRRLVLYLPFELLPHKDRLFRPEALKASSDRFVQSYLKRWRELLEQTDVRANFVDGNILEPELAPNGQPMVRKAAHLIPQLMQKGIVSAAEVATLQKTASSDILKQSIADALAALTPVATGTDGQEFGPQWLANLPDEIAFELQKFDMRAALDDSRGMPPARVAWERMNKQDLLISAYAECIARMLVAERITWDDLPPVLSATQEVPRLAVIRGLKTAVDMLATTDRAKALRFSANFLEHQEPAWTNVPSLYDELESLFAHWVHLRLLTETQALALGFRVPNLEAGFSTASPLASELRGFGDTLECIAKNPEYSRLLYPAAIFFGSRLKGYAKRNADLDVAVFVKPGVSKLQRPKIRRILAELFSDKRIGGKVVEFWLEARGPGLKVRDFPDADVFLGDSSWIHLLLASVWLGKDETLRELYAKLLPGFLHSQGKTFMGQDIRTLWLEEMEREVLQYRLMHKGYRRLFAPSGGVNAGATGLDPQSIFWDSGYRRLATQLFVTRVFLPQLETKK